MTFALLIILLDNLFSDCALCLLSMPFAGKLRRLKMIYLHLRVSIHSSRANIGCDWTEILKLQIFQWQLAVYRWSRRTAQKVAAKQWHRARGAIKNNYNALNFHVWERNAIWVAALLSVFVFILKQLQWYRFSPFISSLAAHTCNFRVHTGKKVAIIDFNFV